MNNDIEIFTNTNTPRVEELEKDVKDVKKRLSKIQTVEELEKDVKDLKQRLSTTDERLQTVEELERKVTELEARLITSPPQKKKTEKHVEKKKTKKDKLTGKDYLRYYNLK
jgi:hypothetical protein